MYVYKGVLHREVKAFENFLFNNVYTGLETKTNETTREQKLTYNHIIQFIESAQDH